MITSWLHCVVCLSSPLLYAKQNPELDATWWPQHVGSPHTSARSRSNQVRSSLPVRGQTFRVAPSACLPARVSLVLSHTSGSEYCDTVMWRRILPTVRAHLTSVCSRHLVSMKRKAVSWSRWPVVTESQIQSQARLVLHVNSNNSVNFSSC